MFYSINALYALYWDIVMDWGMLQNPTALIQQACVGSLHPEGKTSPSCHHILLRPRLRFGLTMSTLIVLADTCLRFSWLLRFVTKFPTNDAFVLCTQFLEVFRRAIWNLLRVEWENIKQQKSKAVRKARDSLSDNEDNNDEEESRVNLLLHHSNNNMAIQMNTMAPRDSLSGPPNSKPGMTAKPGKAKLALRVF
jgi:hypothetical protein